jgi:hypothetical protein
MKKFITYFLVSILGLVLILVLTFASVLFFKPTLIINPQTLEFALNKTDVLESWKWQEAEINHQWIKWNERVISGHFYDFCFSYQHEKASVETCLQEVSWNFNISYKLKDGFKLTTIHPFKVTSNLTQMELKQVPPEDKTPMDPPDVWRYWTMLWSEVVPDIFVKFDKIVLKRAKDTKTFDFFLTKDRSELEAKALDFSLIATPKRIELIAPKAYAIPGDLPTQRPLFLRDFKLSALMTETAIPLEVTGVLEVAPFKINSQIDLPLKADLTSIPFIKKVLLKTHANLKLTDIKKNLARMGPPPFNKLPAPLNAMNGSLNVNVTTEDIKDPQSIVINAMTDIDFEGKSQAFKLGLQIGTPLNLKDYSPGSITLKIDFRKVALQLPRFSKKRAPPQFYPDPRIQNTPQNPVKEDKQKEEEKKSDFSLHLTAEGKKALHVKTNLLDEDLRINFDLFIENGDLKKGFVDLLPLKTTIFRRKIKIAASRVTFRHPLEPVLDANIHFLLPEYKIILTLEGPLSRPRHALTSVPPLPQNDIYAVLLFGRPMADLDPDAQGAASRTNQILAQGIVSLSFLYFLGGSSVEYVGFDPNSGQASAQIGLGRKTSLRVGAGGGSRSTGIRRSLGKGWYLDNSVQNTPSGNSETPDYGVMLERIIAY